MTENFRIQEVLYAIQMLEEDDRRALMRTASKLTTMDSAKAAEQWIERIQKNYPIFDDTTYLMICDDVMMYYGALSNIAVTFDKNGNMLAEINVEKAEEKDSLEVKNQLLGDDPKEDEIDYVLKAKEIMDPLMTMQRIIVFDIVVILDQSNSDVDNIYQTLFDLNQTIRIVAARFSFQFDDKNGNKYAYSPFSGACYIKE